VTARRGQPEAESIAFVMRHAERTQTVRIAAVSARSCWGYGWGYRAVRDGTALCTSCTCNPLRIRPGEPSSACVDVRRHPPASRKQPRAEFLRYFIFPLTSADVHRPPPAATTFLGYVSGYRDRADCVPLRIHCELRGLRHGILSTARAIPNPDLGCELATPVKDSSSRTLPRPPTLFLLEVRGLATAYL
jgi:hypothetical protein